MKTSNILETARQAASVTRVGDAVIVQGPWHDKPLIEPYAQPGATSHEDDDLNPTFTHDQQVRLRAAIDWSRAPSGTSGYIVIGSDPHDPSDTGAIARPARAIWTIGDNGEDRVTAPVFFDPISEDFGPATFLARRPGAAWYHSAIEKANRWLRNEAAQFPREMLLSLPPYTGYTRARLKLHPLSEAVRASLYH